MEEQEPEGSEYEEVYDIKKIIIFSLIVLILIGGISFGIYKLVKKDEIKTKEETTNSLTKEQEEVLIEKQAELSELIQKYDDADRDEKITINNEFVNNRDAALPVLRKTISDGTKDQKIFAADLISDMRDKEAVPNLIKLTENEEMILAISGINALRNIGDERAAPVMRDILKRDDLDESRKITALSTLGVLGSKLDIDLIKRYLDDESEAVQVMAASAMARLGDYSQEDFLIRMITESKETVANKYAVQALAHFDTEKSKAKLQDLIARKATWNSYAALGLEQQKYKKVSQSEKVDFLSDLINNPEFSDYSESTRNSLLSWTFEELADIGTKEAIEFLKKVSFENKQLATHLLKVRGFYVCDKPYIELGYSCCLDNNNNNICDGYEGLIEEKKIPLEEKIERCEIKNATLNCENYKVYENKISLDIRNDIGKKIDISSIEINIGDVVCSAEIEEVILINGETRTFTFDNCQTGNKGQKIEVEIKLVYNVVGSNIIIIRFGDLIAEIE